MSTAHEIELRVASARYVVDICGNLRAAEHAAMVCLMDQYWRRYGRIVHGQRARKLRRRGVQLVAAGCSCTGRRRWAWMPPGNPIRVALQASGAWPR